MLLKAVKEVMESPVLTMVLWQLLALCNFANNEHAKSINLNSLPSVLKTKGKNQRTYLDQTIIFLVEKVKGHFCR